MRTRPAFPILAPALLSLVIGGCSDSNTDSAASEVRQTQFPGQVSSGSPTGGEIMARANGANQAREASGTPGIPKGSGGNTGGAAMGGTTRPAEVGKQGDEGQRGQSAEGDVSGTPGIPEGAGGTPSGAAMGGTTAGAAASQAAPAPAQPSLDKTEQKQAEADKKKQAAAKEKEELAASMEQVSERWRDRAQSEGWETSPPTQAAATSGFGASEFQSSASGQPEGKLGGATGELRIRSEKLGTAPPSEDVKNPAEKGK